MMSASSGDEKTSAAVRINPYSVKKTAPPLFRKPLVDYDDFVEEEELETTNQEKPGAASCTEEDNAAVLLQATPRHQVAAIAAPMSVSLPLWKRLPSQSISFGSSEVLTVSELCQHGLLYEYSNKANHSIRTTGVLRQKIYYPVDGTNTESGEVSLLLEDPLARFFSDTSNTRSEHKGLFQTPVIGAVKNRKGGRRISFGPTPQTPATAATNNKHLQPQKRPSLGGVARGSTVVTPAVPKTPLMNTKLASRTPLQFRTPGLLSSRKRPLPQKTVCLKETLANALASNPTSTLWVVLDPQHVPMDHVAVGDLVTVFGTVHPILAGDGSSSSAEPSGVPPRISPFVRDVASLVMNKQQQESEASNVRMVQARILRQDNGASPRLHWEALKLRRKHLLKTYYHHQRHQQPQGTSEEGPLGSENVPLLGCGPPPYDWGTTEKSSGNGTGVTHS